MSTQIWNNQTHRDLLEKTVKVLESKDYMVFPNGVEARVPETIRERMTRLDDSTTRFIRGSSDLIVVKKISVQLELKSADSDYPNVAIEASPFFHHLNESEVDIVTLYFFDEGNGKRVKAFKCSRGIVNIFHTLYVPEKYQDLFNEMHDFSQAFGLACGPQMLPSSGMNPSASKDPYLLFAKEHLEEFSYAIDLLEELNV